MVVSNLSTMIINMLYTLINSVSYIMSISVMVMSSDIISYVICVFGFLCEISITLKLNKFSYFSFIDIIISVYGIMFIHNDTINQSRTRVPYI